MRRGVVEAVGDAVTDFKPGDRVYYSGSNQRDGSNQTYQLVNENYLAHMPKTLSFAEAAALPLTAITAYETLFDVFNISPNPQQNQGKTLFIINGAKWCWKYRHANSEDVWFDGGYHGISSRNKCLV